MGESKTYYHGREPDKIGITPTGGEERLSVLNLLQTDRNKKNKTGNTSKESEGSGNKRKDTNQIKIKQNGDATSLNTTSSSLSSSASSTTDATAENVDLEWVQGSTGSLIDSVQQGEEGSKYLEGPDQVIPAENLTTWTPEGAVKLRMSATGIDSFKPISVPSLVKKAAKRYGNFNAMIIQERQKETVWTFNKFYHDVRIIAKAFIKLGLERHHAVFIIGFNSPKWVISDLAAIFAGGIATGLYTDRSAEACKLCALSSRAQIIVVGDQIQLEKIIEIKDNLPQLKCIIQYGEKSSHPGVLSWEDLIKIGRHEPDHQLEGRLKRIAINQCCTLIYTSGTTGMPKGVMLSHDNLIAAAFFLSDYADVKETKWYFASNLPFAHISAQITEIYSVLLAGACNYFTKPKVLKYNYVGFLRKVRPTLYLAVPMIWEKVYESLKEKESKMNYFQKLLYDWARSVGWHAYHKRLQQNFRKSLKYRIANYIVFKKVKKLLGFERCSHYLRGAGPMPWNIIEYFCSLDIYICDVYGLSECAGPHVAVLEKEFKEYSIGKTVPGLYTKLAGVDKNGNGELCLSGRNVFMGYLYMEETTDSTIDEDGWLHTGDSGTMDEDGFLYITGRIKEMIISKEGENVFPKAFEDRIKYELPCVSNTMIIGDGREFMIVLLTIKTEMDIDTREPLDLLTTNSMDWCKSVGSSAYCVSDILSGPDTAVMNAIQEGINRVNKNALTEFQVIAKWTLLAKDFSVPGGELGVMPRSLDEKHTVFLNKEDRYNCWESRDAYFSCLDKEGDMQKCKALQQQFESVCPATWVKHFVRKREFEIYRTKIKDAEELEIQK